MFDLIKEYQILIITAVILKSGCPSESPEEWLLKKQRNNFRLMGSQAPMLFLLLTIFLFIYSSLTSIPTFYPPPFQVIIKYAYFCSFLFIKSLVNIHIQCFFLLFGNNITDFFSFNSTILDENPFKSSNLTQFILFNGCAIFDIEDTILYLATFCYRLELLYF